MPTSISSPQGGNRMAGRRWRWTAFLILLLGGFPAAVLADFKADYDDALKAIESEDWSTALSSLESAISDNGQSQERVRMYGMRFIPYLPHYYLGLARYRLGDCQGAIEAWDTAVNQGVIQSQDEYSRLQQERRACEAQVVDVSAIAANAESSLEALEVSLQDLQNLKAEELLADEWSAWEGPLSQGEEGLARLRGALAAAREAKDSDAIESIAAEADQLRQAAQQAAGAASQRLAVVRDQQARRLADARDRARRELLQNVAQARSVLGESAPDSKSRQVQQTLGNLVARADQLGSSASPSAMNQLNRELSGTVRSFRQAVQEFENQQRAIARRTPPPTLKQAVEAYFAGRYETAAELADPAKFQDERERIQALLFRAASRYNLYLLDNQVTRSLLQQAERDIRSIKQLDANFSPYVAAFPPKFTELFEQTRG